MTKKTGAAALAEAKAHLSGGDNSGEGGDNASPGAGDKSGGELQSFTLDAMQLEAHADAVNDDTTEAFWKAAGDRMGFDPATVKHTGNLADSGLFTAVPVQPAGPADLEEQHQSAIERMEEQASAAVLDLDSLVDDTRDFLLGQIKARPKPWSATSKAEQQDVANACEHAAKELTRKVVEALAAQGRKAVRVLLTKINIGDDIVISGKVKVGEPATEDAAITMLHHARGKFVLLTPASADDYVAGREAEVDEDERELAFEPEPDEDESGDD